MESGTAFNIFFLETVFDIRLARVLKIKLKNKINCKIILKNNFKFSFQIYNLQAYKKNLKRLLK